MKCFASIAIAAFCISAALAQSNVETLRSKISANEKAFNDNMKAKEADMWTYRRSNQDKVNAAINKSGAAVKASPISRCTFKTIFALSSAKHRLTALSSEITAYYNTRKAIIEKEANAGFKADRKAADDLQKKYEACADDTCKADVNKEIDAKVAELANAQDIAQSDGLIERTRRYSGTALGYMMMRVEYVDIDTSNCLNCLKKKN